ncbi:formate dehydrogenase subunit delta [Methylobacillus flagellatus]|uniref:formate dehydrogenase subunit delta n=1 Tax=Methylobacillus flagellatus TaxID=405 RepID=UPI0010F8524C|nr:formate dehydrogenase subunit delta [Methylobacillus flagellatus]
MQTQRLLEMANQIGDFFQSYPDPVEARKDIANHLKKFWALSMREQIIAHVEAQQGAGLHAIVGEAIKEHRATLAS